jgi:hypothetical protein
MKVLLHGEVVRSVTGAYTRVGKSHIGLGL